jgi:hypothetical protein
VVQKLIRQMEDLDFEEASETLDSVLLADFPAM